jgi:hypothetical protein
VDSEPWMGFVGKGPKRPVVILSEAKNLRQSDEILRCAQRL